MDNNLKQVNDALEELQKYNQTLQNLNNNFKEITQENEAYKIVRQKQEEIISDQSNEIDKLQKKNDDLNQQNYQLLETIQEKDEIIGQLKKRIDELEQIKLTYEQELLKHKEQNENLQKDKKELEEKVSGLEQELLKQNEQNDNLQKKQNELEQKVNELEQQLQKQNEQNENLHNKQNELEQKVNELELEKQERQQEMKKKEEEWKDELQKLRNEKEVKVETALNGKEQEAQAFIEMINNLLKNDEQLQGRIPLDASNSEDLYEKVKDGVILCKFLNGMLPNTIDPRAINLKEPLEEEHKVQNLNMAISGAKSHGCMLGSLNSEDIYQGKKDEILNMIWEITRAALVNTVNVHNCPNLLNIKEEEESQENFMKVPAEEMLMRWINHHLKQAHIHRKVSNFSTDLKDGEILIGLTNYLEKYYWSPSAENTQRISKAIKSARFMNTNTLLRPEPLSAGHYKLSLLFSSQLFQAVPALKTISEDESKELATLIEGQDIGDSREERTFRMWINSLSLTNTQYLTNLFEDITDGVILLRILDYMQPGCVPWDKVQKKPTHFLQKVQNQLKSIQSQFQTANCNMFMEIAKKSLGLQLVAIGSEDILNKNKKLVLAIIWQLMIKDVMKTIGDLKENDLVKWANERIGDKEPKIKNLKDPNIKNCVFLFNLLSAINPKLIDWSIVQEDEDTESLKSNAQYIISIVRKLGASLFIVWEDIYELKTKMIMTLFASLKTYDQHK